jgi:leader peptidase (prepilin peptidase) / N-methyltransferase
MFYAELLITACLGLVLGSFTTALVHRVPRHLDWVAKRSFCTGCEKPLGVLDLVPVFSWLLSGGKCRHCGAGVSSRYPAIEIAVMLASILTYMMMGFTIESIFIFAAIPLIAALFVIDLDHMILPNQLVFLLGVFGVCRLFFEQALGGGGILPNLIALHIASGLAYAGLAWFLGWFLTKVLKKEALGFGDVKFFLVAGIWLGFAALPYFLILSGFMGIVCALVWKIIYKSEIFPFGPALIISFFALLMIQGG